MARKAGFTNINVDLMSALPGQCMDSYKDTLLKVCALEPELLPSEDEERKMDALTQELLAEHGLLDARELYWIWARGILSF